MKKFKKTNIEPTKNSNPKGYFIHNQIIIGQGCLIKKKPLKGF